MLLFFFFFGCSTVWQNKHKYFQNSKFFSDSLLGLEQFLQKKKNPSMSHCKKQTLLMSRHFFREIQNFFFLHKQLCQPITMAVQISIYPWQHQKPPQQQQRLTSSSSVSVRRLLLDKQTVTDASENTSWNGLGTVFAFCVFFSRGVGMYSKVLFFPLGKHNENQVSIARGCQFLPSCFL